MEPRKVKLGDTELTVQRFRGLKAILAASIVSRITREVPGVQDEIAQFVRDYSAKNTITLTPAMAKLPRYRELGLTAEDFKAGEGTVQLPDQPTVQQQALAAFPLLFDLARKELLRLLALVVIPNSELEQADSTDQVDDALDGWVRKLLYQGDIDELAELLIVASEVLSDQFADKRARLGKLADSLPLLKALRSTPPPTAKTETEAETPKTSPDESPSSSTASPTPTDGPERRLSSLSPGMSS